MKYLAAPIGLALMLLIAPAMGANPPAVVAQAQSPQAQSPQASPSAPALNLTAEQKAQIEQIRQDSRQRIQALFSSEQRQTYATLRKRGIAASQAIEMIALDRTSRDQLRQILRESGAAIVKVLGQP